jgi:hypothetical protein
MFLEKRAEKAVSRTGDFLVAGLFPTTECRLGGPENRAKSALGHLQFETKESQFSASEGAGEIHDNVGNEPVQLARILDRHALPAGRVMHRIPVFEDHIVEARFPVVIGHVFFCHCNLVITMIRSVVSSRKVGQEPRARSSGNPLDWGLMKACGRRQEASHAETKQAMEHILSAPVSPDREAWSRRRDCVFPFGTGANA